MGHESSCPKISLSLGMEAISSATGLTSWETDELIYSENILILRERDGSCSLRKRRYFSFYYLSSKYLFI